MGKAVLISIQPKWCELIASGEKTVEVRKTKPKLETPFTVYIYETKGKKQYFSQPLPIPYNEGKGKVIGEFVCDKIECFTTDYRANWAQTKRISEQSCVCILDLSEYEAQSNCLYAWHISSLVIYDKPKALSEFEKPWKEWVDANGVWHDIRPCQCGKPCKHTLFDDAENSEICGIDYDGESCPYIKIIRPPQSWCYVEEREKNGCIEH